LYTINTSLSDFISTHLAARTRWELTALPITLSWIKGWDMEEGRGQKRGRREGKEREEGK